MRGSATPGARSTTVTIGLQYSGSLQFTFRSPVPRLKLNNRKPSQRCPSSDAVLPDSLVARPFFYSNPPRHLVIVEESRVPLVTKSNFKISDRRCLHDHTAFTWSLRKDEIDLV